MEVASCVQAVVNTAAAYQSNPSESNLTQFQRQLDVLISLTSRGTSLAFFNPREVLPTECLSYLVDILDDPQTKSTLAQKVMLLLDILADNSLVRAALHTTYLLTASLARFLWAQTISAADPNTVLCVKLLHKITYSCKVDYQESYIEDLVVFLFNHVREKEDELTLPCIGLMANLCRNNLPIQVLVKNQGQAEVHAFYHRLSSQLSNKNSRIVVFSLSILANLSLNEGIGEKIFNPKNIKEIFRLLFNILVNGECGTTRRYTIDVFVDFLKHSKIKDALAVYEHVGRCVAQILSLLSKKQGNEMAKIFELLMSLCSVSGVRCEICRRLLETPLTSNTLSVPKGEAPKEVFHAVIHWANQSTDTHCDAPLLALDFLREMYEEILDQGLLATASPRTDLVLSVIVKTLKQVEIPEGDHSRKHCLKINKALQLAQFMVSEETLLPLVAGVVTMDSCVRQIEHQLQHNSVALKGMRWTPSTQPTDWSEEGVGIVLHTLDLMISLRHLVNNIEVHLCNILQDPRLVSFLSHGLTSGIRDRIHIVIKVIGKASNLPEFPATVLGDYITAQMSQKHEDKSSESNPVRRPSVLRPLGNKENMSHGSNSSALPGTHEETGEKSFDVELNSLIEKMQSGMPLKDARTSEIISVYEHKIQSHQTKESHLHDLLEAKTLAMTQADRLITQFRCRIARSEAETQQLRCMLQDWEERGESFREQLNENVLERERLSNDLEQMAQDNARLEGVTDEHRELLETFTEQSQKLENTQRSLTTLRQEHKSLTEMHEMQRRHNDTLKNQYDVASEQLIELEEERKNQSKLLKEKEGKLQETTKTLQKCEKELRKVTKERDDLETAIDGLRIKLATAESCKKELQHQVSALELVCRQHEDSLKEKEHLLEDQKQEIEKHKKIAALINDITSGKKS